MMVGVKADQRVGEWVDCLVGMWAAWLAVQKVQRLVEWKVAMSADYSVVQ